MASTSANRGNSRITTAATTLYSDNQSLIAEIRKALSVIRALAVDFEKGNKPEKVKELEEAMLDLLATSNDCTHFSSAIESVGNNYQPKDENVHHAGQPMPGEEQEDIVMTSTESSLLNITCPLSGKPVIELEDPVRSMDCKHIYDKKAVVHYMKSKNSSIQCPVAGCPKKLAAGRVVCDPLLHIEIEEMRSRSTQIIQATIVEDFTELDEGEN
ncbi:E3 SUMO-protein ligase MMS21 isoform X2 [Magnolia sinica]|uniref:E3 SUMO-protein ligase MMS21 isoform X2 n=1 Tax=Magnolia sinica TaxID=86752 RepID=UPI00265B3191|nr:E3 SUMO-protein ligase MMS21 isoform X2 [Magnolia sinica]